MASAGGSTLAARIVSQASQLVLFIVAARVLAPADFGVFALVAAVSTLLFLMAAAGWREFIMGWGGNARAINQAITYALISGYVMTAVGVAGSAAATVFFKAQMVAYLGLMFSACIFLSPMTTALGAILVRQDKVPSLSFATIAAELIGLCAGVAGLLLGWGILALGVSKLVMQMVHLAGVAAYARWPIKLIVRGGYGSEIIEISRQILANRTIGFVSGNASTFIVGAYLGVAQVGYFRAAERVVSAFMELVFEPLRLLAWIVFRKAADVADSDGKLREELAREGSVFFPMIVLLASPIFVGLAVISSDVVSVLLGETWRPAGPVVSVLAIAALLITPSVANEPLLTMTGKIRSLPPVALFNAAIAVITLLVFTQFGIMAAAFARLGASFVLMATSVWIQNIHAHAPWWGTMKKSAPVYAALMALVAAVLFTQMFLEQYAISMLGQLVIEIFVGAVAYFVMILMVRPSYLRTTLWL